jgi:hypothetical protein
MRKSTKAALLSGLVFPGIGHLFLKQYLRGSILVTIALGSSAAIIRSAIQHAQTVVDSILSGEAPMDSGNISEMISASYTAPENTVATLLMLLLTACWLIGIVDSWRAGRKQDEQ